jgi:hypothetical protein
MLLKWLIRDGISGPGIGRHVKERYFRRPRWAAGIPAGGAEISESQLHLAENVLDTGPMTLHFLNVLLVLFILSR